MVKSLFVTAAMILCGLPALAEIPAADAATTVTAPTVSMAHAVDLAAAQKIFQKTCRACHGNKAQGASSYPKLSDKEPDYIVERLQRYRLGEKIGPNSVLMIQNAKKLSDADIANLSVYVTTAFD